MNLPLPLISPAARCGRPSPCNCGRPTCLRSAGHPNDCCGGATTAWLDDWRESMLAIIGATRPDDLTPAQREAVARMDRASVTEVERVFDAIFEGGTA